MSHIFMLSRSCVIPDMSLMKKSVLVNLQSRLVENLFRLPLEILIMFGLSNASVSTNSVLSFLSELSSALIKEWTRFLSAFPTMLATSS